MNNSVLSDKLLQTAQLQNTYLNLFFDFERRERIANVDVQRCSIIKQQLELLKNWLDAYYQKQHCSAGIYWWRIPCDEVVQTVIEQLTAETERDGWRLEHTIHCLSEADKNLLYVVEEGHYSDFFGNTETSYGKVSQYTEEEQRAMVAARNARIDFEESLDIATTEGKVYSPTYNKVYDSAYDFYTSFEHRLARQDDSDFYARTLYRVKESVNAEYYSNSRHYTTLFSIAGFIMSPRGHLLGINLPGIRKLSVRGYHSDTAGAELHKRDMVLLCMSYFAEAESIKKVPVDLFDSDFISEFAVYEQAVQAAARFTCIAQKLDCFEIDEPQYFLQSETEFEQYKSIFMRFESGENIPLSDLETALDVIIKKLLPFEEQMSLELHTALLWEIAKRQDGIDKMLFYASACVHTAMASFDKVPSPFLLETYIQASVVMAEFYLRKKNKKCAETYAAIALNGCDELAQLNPGSKVLNIQKSAKKLLKKAQKKGVLF